MLNSSIVFRADFNFESEENCNQARRFAGLLDHSFSVYRTSEQKQVLHLYYGGLYDCSSQLRLFLTTVQKFLKLNYNFQITKADAKPATHCTGPYSFVMSDDYVENRAVDIDKIIDILCHDVPSNTHVEKTYAFKAYSIVDGVKMRTASGGALNSMMYWNFEDPLPDNVPIWVLAEQDTCDPTQIPSVFRIIHEPKGQGPYQNRLLDFDPEEQEEYLSGNNWEIVAWRYMTDHNGLFDTYYAKHGVTELSNWAMTLDKQEPE